MTTAVDYDRADDLVRRLTIACHVPHDRHGEALRRAEAFGRMSMAYALAHPDEVESIVADFEAHHQEVTR